MSQPEQWIAYVRSPHRASAATAHQHQEAAIRAVLPAGANIIMIADTGSGLTGQRPGFERVRALVCTGSITGVAAYDRSRISRNPGLLRDFIAELKAFGVELRLATHAHETDAVTATLEDHLRLLVALATSAPRATIRRPTRQPRVSR